jgi:transposase-like protein
MDKKIIQKAGKFYTESERHQIIQDYLSSECTKTEIWKKYTGKNEEHGQLFRWMLQLGYNTTERPNIASKSFSMSKKIASEKSDETFENLQLKKRIAELEKKLKDAELKAIAFSTMVDIAEKEFKIPIRKKLNTKP